MVTTTLGWGVSDLEKLLLPDSNSIITALESEFGKDGDDFFF